MQDNIGTLSLGSSVVLKSGTVPQGNLHKHLSTMGFSEIYFLIVP